jgi:cellulose synthase/poly-beta-1,6-N-acetylglucosamine synthase-like glycosyltransferase
LSEVHGAAVRHFKAGDWRDGGPPLTVFGHAGHRARALPKPRPGICPEVDCIRDLLPRRIIAAAERRARSIGLGAERVLICADAITEGAYLAALAASLGTIYEPLDRVSRADCPLNDHELIRAAAAGLLPLRDRGRLIWVIAPRCLTARRLADPHQPHPGWLRPYRLTSSEHLQRFVARHTQRALGRRAADELRHSRPLLSNAPRAKGWRSGTAIALAMPAVMLLGLAPAVTVGAFGMALCTIFLATAALRLWSAFITDKAPRRSVHIDDDRLPIYTILCALYRESAVVNDLVAAIRALDYPPEKLDVKFVLEADDHDTKRALAGLELGPPFEIITAPAIGPRTKPKALNVALPFARGSFTVVYDAEDAPEPDQLRRAVGEFMSAGDRLACVQASLTIDNTADNWLARMFTAGYAGQFDVLLPGLAAMHLPFPLGGSSNHFRTAVLRKIGGWDPYNVTEDADLGIRLYRLGYRSVALASATYQEAPARFVQWLKQRTRWYKGWMQTWLVHMRRPRRLLRELTPAGAFTFQLLLAGNVLAALVHPVFMAALCYALLAQPPLRAVDAMGNAAPMFAATLLCGYASTIVLDAIGLRRRGLLAHAWVLILTPLYWLLLSLAAWRALLQLWRDPQRWEKTEHGLAKTSRVSGTRISISNRSPAIRTGYSPLAPAAIMARSRGPMLEFARDDQALFPVLRRKRRKRSSDAAPILSTRPFDSHQGGLS